MNSTGHRHLRRTLANIDKAAARKKHNFVAKWGRCVSCRGDAEHCAINKCCDKCRHVEKGDHDG